MPTRITPQPIRRRALGACLPVGPAFAPCTDGAGPSTVLRAAAFVRAERSHVLELGRVVTAGGIDGLAAGGGLEAAYPGTV